MLRVDHLTVGAGDFALRELTFHVAPGDYFVLLGPSGAGKTVLLEALAGARPVDSGRIVLDGRDITKTPARDRHFGLVYQDGLLFPHLSVARNIAYGLRARGRARGEQRARIAALAGDLGIEPLLHRRPATLSGGETQRVALARALAPDPPIILLDEPFSGLDPRLRITIREDTINILKSRGTTTLIVTHDPEEAMYLSDTMAVMRDGRIEQIGTPGELYCQPVTPYVALFFSAANLIRGAVESGCVATPFGPIPAPKLKEGARAVVLIRPEALLIDGERNSGMATALGAAEGTVISSRMLRHSVVTRMDFGDFNGERLQLRVRNSGHFMPDAGARFRVALDSQQTFVFPIRDKRQGG